MNTEIAKTAQRTAAEGIALRVANSSLTSFIQRDGQSSPLLTYDLNTTIAPLSDAQEEQEAFKTNIVQELKGLPQEEQYYAGMILPRLISALALNEQHTSRIYRQDISGLAQIAVDWCLNPDAIDETHIRIGYGGDERLTALGPAYATAAFETVEQVKQVFEDQRNYALLNSLIYSTDNPEKKTEIRRWFNAKMAEIAEKDENGEPIVERNDLLDAHMPSSISSGIVTDVLVEGWRHFNGNNPDMDALKKQYHFPDAGKFPQIYVFNAAHAAVNINSMDPDKVLQSRDLTQSILTKYATTYHPDIASALHFQNDTDWNTWATDLPEDTEGRNDPEIVAQQAAYTKLYVKYTGELLDGLNGQKSTAGETLEAFASHHNQNGKTKILGVKPYELYGTLHFPFFYDKQRAERNNRLPRTGIMQDIPEPRNIVYHQGPPELKFGVYRKLVSQNLQLDQFTKWLEERTDYSKYAEISEAVKEAADAAFQDNPNIPYKKHIGEAITNYFKQFVTDISGKKKQMTKEEITAVKKQNAPYENMKSELSKHLGNTSFKDAADSQKAWEDIVDGYKQVNTKEVALALAYTKSHQQALSQFITDMYTGTLTDEQLASAQAFTALYPLATVEEVTQVGEIPVYYPYAGLDNVLATDPEKGGTLPAREAYEAYVRETKDREKRLRGTTALGEKEGGKLHRALGEASHIASLAPSAGDDDLQKQLLEDTSAVLKKKYEENYLLEISLPGNKDYVLEHIGNSVSDVASSLLATLQEQGMTQEQAATYAYTHALIPRLVSGLKEQIGKDTKVEVKRAEGRLKDYMAILRDIDPTDLQKAEEEYHAFLQGITTENGEHIVHHSGNIYSIEEYKKSQELAGVV